MNNSLFSAKVIATGTEIVVYKLGMGSERTGDYCNYADCSTVYKPNELTHVKEKSTT